MSKIPQPAIPMSFPELEPDGAVHIKPTCINPDSTATGIYINGTYYEVPNELWPAIGALVEEYKEALANDYYRPINYAIKMLCHKGVNEDINERALRRYGIH